MPVHAVVSGTTPTQRYGSTSQPCGSLVTFYRAKVTFCPGNFVVVTVFPFLYRLLSSFACVLSLFPGVLVSPLGSALRFAC